MRSRLLAALLSLLAVSALPAQAQTSASTEESSIINNGLQKLDVKTGSGKELQSGNIAVVHYTGWIYDSFAPRERGTQFDSSVGRGVFSFPVGAGKVIKGWDQGVVGMKVGGKRTLIVPSEMAYGARGAGAMIPPHSTLIFDIELLDVR